MEHAVATTGIARIGPNAIIQTVAALGERYGGDQQRAILAGPSAAYLERPPSAMIAEQAFHELVELLVERLGSADAVPVLERSGQRTADYVRANRIPAAVQLLLRLLPPGLRLRLFLPAISQHAWTFAGSGVFKYATGRRPWLSIQSPTMHDRPAIAAPLCAYYHGAFEGLLQQLITPRLQLRETACQVRGDEACVYQIVY